MLRLLARIMIAAAVLLEASALAGASDKAPPDVKAEFTAFIAKFRAALKADDAAAVAAMAKLPFMADPNVSDAKQFKATVYKESLTPANRACIRRGKAIYEREPDNHDTYAIFCYELIFVFTRMPQGFLLTDISVND